MTRDEFRERWSIVDPAHAADLDALLQSHTKELARDVVKWRDLYVMMSHALDGVGKWLGLEGLGLLEDPSSAALPLKFQLQRIKQHLTDVLKQESFEAPDVLAVVELEEKRLRDEATRLLASPEAAKRLDAYQEQTDRILGLEAQLFEARQAGMVATQEVLELRAQVTEFEALPMMFLCPACGHVTQVSAQLYAQT